MKANEAPEKIYLNWVNYPLEEIQVEYIRTDAFIEKAQLFLIGKLKEIPMGNGKFKIKAECSLEEFIEKFENYIKED